MQKMKLSLDHLRVESFEPALAIEGSDGRGLAATRPAECSNFDSNCGYSVCRSSPCACI